MYYHAIMKLKDYLHANKMTQLQFIDLANKYDKPFSIHAVAKWCQDKRIPRQDEMATIYTLTNGEVTPNDFYILPDKKF